VSAGADWLERQYWSDVVAVRPVSEIETRIAQSNAVRAQQHAILDVSYGADERQKFDLFVPESPGPRPLLVFIHGGYWRRGSKDEWAFLAPGWTSRGVAFAALGYRLLPAVQLADIVADTQAALGRLVEHAEEYKLDTGRIVVTGISAGAHLAAMYVTEAQVTPARAAVLLSGVYDPRPLETTTPGVELAGSLSGDLADISPLARKPPRCPCIFAWGADETRVFENQSRALAAQWANWGIESEMAAIPHTNHFTICDSLRADGKGPVSDFILRHVAHE
jgi:arylformamidase